MDEDELQDDQLDTDGDNEDTDSGSDNSAPPTDESKPAAKGKDRHAGLMSNWQREEARANRLQAELDALKGGAGDAGGSSGAGTSDDIEEFRDFARDTARNTLFTSDPRLAEMGLEASDITGNTLGEMRASLAKHQKLIGGMEGRMRNRILSEHGLDPEVATGAGTEKPPSFSTMTDKQFNDYLAERDSRPR